MSQDILGTALLSYVKNADQQFITTKSSITEDDEVPVSYFFREFDEMPVLEQKALSLSKGDVLDVGCGAGSHSLFLQKKGLNVSAVDISEGAIKVAQKRGVNAFVKDVFTLETAKKYDTVLVLMNGTGICGTLNKLADYLLHLSSLLKPNGQILIDSSDLIYMYEDEDGEYWVDASKGYYGEVTFAMEFEGKTTAPFNWLYVDYNTLQRCAVFNGMVCELIAEGEHYDYLAKITKA